VLYFENYIVTGPWPAPLKQNQLLTEDGSSIATRTSSAFGGFTGWRRAVLACDGRRPAFQAESATAANWPTTPSEMKAKEASKRLVIRPSSATSGG
jgi:hypothetical protein